jgi:protein-S-isoprenylcysteine O-methyltransferase Ste14
MDEVQPPDEQQMEQAEDRRQRAERREAERRSGGRRAEDRARSRSYQFWATAWAIVGSIVVLYLFLLGLNAFSPGEAPVATGIILALAVAWLAHAWRRIAVGGFVSRPDRERRGF